MFRGSLSFLWSGENEGTPRGSCRYPDLGSRLKRHPHLIALSFRHPPPTSVCNSPAVSGLSYWSPCLPAREQNQVNRRPGKGVRTEVRAPPQRGPQPPGRWGLAGVPSAAPSALEGLGQPWVVAGLKRAVCRQGIPRLRQGQGIPAPHPSQGQQSLPPPGEYASARSSAQRGRRGRSPGAGDGQREGRLDTPAANDAAQAGRSQLGGDWGRSDQRGRRRKLIHPQA